MQTTWKCRWETERDKKNVNNWSFERSSFCKIDLQQLKEIREREWKKEESKKAELLLKVIMESDSRAFQACAIWLNKIWIWFALTTSICFECWVKKKLRAAEDTLFDNFFAIKDANEHEEEYPIEIQ